jgi:hypothetical protein
MSEHDELDVAETEDGNADQVDVEAHGLREAAVTGLSAAAMIVGAGDAIAATSPGHASVAAKQAVHKIDATIKVAAVSKDAVFKGAAVHKDATFKGNAVHKDAVFKGNAVEKQAVDPSARQGHSDAS